jgi:hypothetical protein
VDEEWRPIPGYEGLYEVSNLGRVRSHDQTLNRKNGLVRWRGRVLKPQEGSKGHFGVNLHREGSSKTHYIHRLVAEVFIPNPDGLPLVRHLNDIKSDNRLENLAWGTPSDNTRDAIRNGRDFNRQRDKTHCPRGHPYEGDNLYRDPIRGARHCRTCKSESQRSEESREMRRERGQGGLPEGDKRHGTLNGYSNYGCRCSSCKEVARVRNERRRVNA